MLQDEQRSGGTTHHHGRGAYLLQVRVSASNCAIGNVPRGVIAGRFSEHVSWTSPLIRPAAVRWRAAPGRREPAACHCYGRQSDEEDSEVGHGNASETLVELVVKVGGPDDVGNGGIDKAPSMRMAPYRPVPMKL
jgi:hypothetical protein